LLVGLLLLRIWLFFPLWLLLMPGLIYILITSYGSASIQSGYFVNSIVKGNTQRRQIVLSFDDGPTADYTPGVLKILAEQQISATFFCIGEQIEQHPDVLINIHQAGHLIGNHSYSHSLWFDFFSAKKVEQELIKTDEMIEKLTQQRPKWFRPPYGVSNPMIAKALKKTKHQLIGWNVRSLDTVIKDEQKVVARIMKQLKPGAIVLLHDRHPRILVMLPLLLKEIKKADYEVVSAEIFINQLAYAQ